MAALRGERGSAQLRSAQPPRLQAEAGLQTEALAARGTSGGGLSPNQASELTPFPWVLEGPLTALVTARNRWAFGRAMSRVSPCMESLGRSLHLYLTVPCPWGPL